MGRVISEEKINHLIDVGIQLFAERGYDATNTNVVARLAEVSVGVVFKRYGSKEGFFMACLEKSLEELDKVMESVAHSQEPIWVRVDMLLRALIKSSRMHPEYIKMYHSISSSSNTELMKKVSDEVERRTAELYTQEIRWAQEAGEFRDDVDPAFCAFLFDNLLMMLQFSYSCDYYKQRFLIYTGETEESFHEEEFDEWVIDQMKQFLRMAFEKKR